MGEARATSSIFIPSSTSAEGGSKVVEVREELQEDGNEEALSPLTNKFPKHLSVVQVLNNVPNDDPAILQCLVEPF